MNCIIIDDDEMSRNALKHLVSQVSYLNLIGVYTKASESLTVLYNRSVDLILLDIEMPDISGLEFIKTIKDPPLTIFVTSKKEYAIEAFECNIIDYLVKPILLDRFFKAITKSKEIFETYKKNDATLSQDYLFVKVNGTIVKISNKEILWVEALGDYININTFEKKYTIHSTMKTMESKLDDSKFIRVHRSYIISIANINSIDDNIIVINKQLIPIGLVYREKLIKRLNLL
ncbi:MAG: LytTR family DNA-binding domain-containing protein [Bacteroidota bacterium]|jgi:DNA-binding LytR/AlgR family response regulator